jgi:hypothetical protein
VSRSFRIDQNWHPEVPSMDQPTPDTTTEPTGLLVSVEPLPAARERDQRSGGAVTDNDGNDR